MKNMRNFWLNFIVLEKMLFTIYGLWRISIDTIKIKCALDLVNEP
jgi:hypothetical protein